MAVVTISRVIGAGGDEIAEIIAEKLGYELVDNALIVKVAERAGVSVENAAEFDEKYQSKTLDFVKSIIGPRVGKILTDEGAHLDPETYVEYCKTVISGLAEQGNIVIVGRAGQFILKDVDNAFHIRIIAGDSFRKERLIAKRGFSDHEAVDCIKKSDSMKKSYIDHYLHEGWGDPGSYHLTLDSSKLGIEIAVQIITDAVESFSRMSEYIPGEKDRRKKTSRRVVNRRTGDRRYSEVGVSKKELSHIIMREGRPSRLYTKPDRRNDERRAAARRNVNSEND